VLQLTYNKKVTIVKANVNVERIVMNLSETAYLQIKSSIFNEMYATSI